MPASNFGELDHHGGGGGLALHQQQHHHLPSSNSSANNYNTSSSSPSSGGHGGGGGGGSPFDEDQRALQLALELSMLGLSENSLGSLHHLVSSSSGMGGGGMSSGTDLHHHHQQQQQQQQHHHLFGGHNNIHGLLQQHHHQQQQNHHMHNHLQNSASDIYSMANGSDLLPKKSQNMTECVPVPSSEHVAEIVGRQGCKIKALRAKTNTYIKTPVRGEEPVFVVTGRKEDVAAAKREILSAADHFSAIRASRKGGSGTGPAAPAPVPGQITIQVRVPYRVVGLVVGPKGATIKRIQQQTHTYIVTPSREKDPVFEVTGLPENVHVARREIEAHIAIRTGSFPSEQTALLDSDLANAPSASDLLATLYKNGMASLGLEGLGLISQLGGTINSLSSSLSSVSGNGMGAGATLAQNGNSAGSIGSSSSGGGSLSSLSSLNAGFSAKMVGGNMGQSNADNGYYTQQALYDLTSSLMDNTSNINNTNQANGFMSSSRSEDSYLYGASGPNSIEDGAQPQTKLPDIFAPATKSVGSSVWGSFDRDEGLGDSPTLETAPTASNLINLQ